MNPEGLISVARQLANPTGSGRPSQVSLRRAVSTTYYALFHTVCRNVADLYIGLAGREGHMEGDTWALVYRALNHGTAKEACERALNSQQIPESITKFAEEFIKVQKMRHNADYKPFVHFNRSDVLQVIMDVETVINAFNNENKLDRKAFVTRLLFKERS